MVYNINIEKNKYFKAILMIINSMGLGLTELELSLLAAILNNGFLILDTERRKILKTKLSMDSFTFNNYIKRLKDKGILTKKENTLIVRDKLIEQIKDAEVHIIFNIYDSDNNS